jgi:hypothetical protein
MCLLALRFPNLPLNGFCGVHFSLAHLAFAMVYIAVIQKL